MVLKIMKYQRRILTLFFVGVSVFLTLTLSGCASTHQIITGSMQKTVGAQQDKIVYEDNTTKLSPKASAYLAYPNDGNDEYHSYPDSGKLVMNLLKDNFKACFSKFDYAQDYQSAQNEYLQAQSKGYQYFILPRILNWTDSYTLLTGVPAKVSITLKIYDLKTNQLLDSVEIKSISSQMPGFEKTPLELLSEPMKTVTRKLFTTTKKG
ncbi:DUF4823 domain-containing protein [Facilibium subflavum]|uniref:DUF4823 domain-containing protein n=1 Tax=Facilibium subflavum TaxID=2219058 RepID=UPI000E6592AE|nr:DUF4823 domain-containing protein [Facilibium subflavum]